MNSSRFVALSVLALMMVVPNVADAFCGFYVSGANAELYNDATLVVMMREGKRTVLSMRNDYKGPPEDFALVIPVPEVLQKENVKTLDPEVFDKVDKMAAPRLVEYWERDPCYEEPDYEYDDRVEMSAAPEGSGAPAAVKVEAEFKVGEYDVVVLSSTESTALDTYLKDNEYNIPKGAEPVLRPYVQGGMYFFVAKVDVKRVKFEGNRARLSPLRFHYDTDKFTLPVRLGLLNADGDQDLLIHILAKNQRYEVANVPNTTIPTNIEVSEDVKQRFPEFYAALFDRTLDKHNRDVVVTEYAWLASSCDPCPGPTLDGSDFATLGADALGSDQPKDGRFGRHDWVLTRLHARYNKKTLKEDLVFKAAAPIQGGREHDIGTDHAHSATSGSFNNFQGRYIIRHPWDGAITCLSPERGVWGGPPEGGSGVSAAQDTALAPRGNLELASVVRNDIPAVEVKAGLSPVDVSGSGPCGACSTVPMSTKSSPALALVALMALGWLWRKRRQ